MKTIALTSALLTLSASAHESPVAHSHPSPLMALVGVGVLGVLCLAGQFILTRSK